MGEKIVFFINVTGNTEDPHSKEKKKWAFILQKLTECEFKT